MHTQLWEKSTPVRCVLSWMLAALCCPLGANQLHRHPRESSGMSTWCGHASLSTCLQLQTRKWESDLPKQLLQLVHRPLDHFGFWWYFFQLLHLNSAYFIVFPLLRQLMSLSTTKTHWNNLFELIVKSIVSGKYWNIQNRQKSQISTQIYIYTTCYTYRFVVICALLKGWAAWGTEETIQERCCNSVGLFIHVYLFTKHCGTESCCFHTALLCMSLPDRCSYVLAWIF